MSGPATQTGARRLSTPSRAAIVIAVLAALVAQLSLQRQAAVLTLEAQPRVAHQDAYLLPPAETLKVIGLGHDQMMADLVWLRALTYFAVHFYLDRDYRWLDRYIETIVELDPDFRLIYQWAGVVVMYGGQRIDNRAVMSSNRFLEMGRQRYPDDWLLNFMLGCNYRYELVPDNPQQAREWRLLGATYLRRAAELPEAPAWLALTALRTLERYGSGEEAIGLAIEAFLSQRGILSATNRAEMALYDHYPELGQHGALELGSLVANGLTLRERLADIEWWSILDQRRLLYADLDTASGYLPWEIRVLVRGDPSERTRPEATPVDVAFFPTLEVMADEPDPDHR